MDYPYTATLCYPSMLLVNFHAYFKSWLHQIDKNLHWLKQHATRASWNHIQYFVGNGCQLQFRLEDFCCKPIKSPCKWFFLKKIGACVACMIDIIYVWYIFGHVGLIYWRESCFNSYFASSCDTWFRSKSECEICKYWCFWVCCATFQKWHGTTFYLFFIIMQWHYTLYLTYKFSIRLSTKFAYRWMFF